MRLKSIALLVVAMLLVVGSASALAIAGAEDAMLLKVGPAGAMAIAGGEDEAGADDVSGGVYWWEDAFDLCCYCPTSDEHRQAKQAIEIIILVIDRYFGTDVSRMSWEEMDEVWVNLGPEGQEKYLRLFKEYAQRKGFEIPEHQGYEPAVAPPVQDVYWWEIVGNPEGKVEWIMDQIAEAKGMTPEEVEEKFGELFPGVDLWSMTFDEFDNFLDSLPRPPLRPICLDELRQNPYIIAVFGRVPAFSTDPELIEFTEKLNKVRLEVCPLFRKSALCESPLREFPLFGTIGLSLGVIDVFVDSDQLPGAEEAYRIAEEVYRIIAEKAERLFGIQDVPVAVFRKEKLQADRVDLLFQPDTRCGESYTRW